MKKIILACAISSVASFCFAQSATTKQMFDKYAGKEGFTSVSISEKLFDLLASAAPETDADIKEMAGEIKGVRILTFQNAEGSAKTKELYKEAEQLIPSDMDELMNINADGENVRLFVTQSSEKIIDQLFMIVGGEDEFVLIDIFGKIDLSKISKLSEKMNIDGLEQLKKIENK